MNKRQSWRVNLYWTIIGALLGNLLATPTERMENALYTWLYQGRPLLGKASASAAEAARHGSGPAGFRACPKGE